MKPTVTIDLTAYTQLIQFSHAFLMGQMIPKVGKEMGQTSVLSDDKKERVVTWKYNDFQASKVYQGKAKVKPDDTEEVIRLLAKQTVDVIIAQLSNIE